MRKAPEPGPDAGRYTRQTIIETIMKPILKSLENCVTDLQTSKPTPEPQADKDSTPSRVLKPSTLRASTMLTPSELESLRAEMLRDSLWLKQELDSRDKLPD
jgi:hypothetical protein